MKMTRFGPIADGLLYTADIPFGWQKLADLPSSPASLKLSESNKRIFQLLLNEGREQDVEVINDSVAQEIRRLDSKVDLLISMVGKLLTRDDGVYASHKIWLGQDGLQILLGNASGHTPIIELPVVSSFESASELNTRDCMVKISLFLDPHFPQPVELLANAVIVKTENTDSVMVATFIGLDQEVQDLLEKFIFQQHRRVIALTRVKAKNHNCSEL